MRVCTKLSLLALIAVGPALFLGSCSQLPVKSKQGSSSLAKQQLLNSSLKVAAATLEAGQLTAARRLYENLSRDFPSAPEPKLGLAHLALHAGDFASADALFTEASTLATAPAVKAEALLGAGRASLGQEDLAQARSHLLAAVAQAKGTPLASWVANGLAVVASLESDYARAKKHYDEAIALSSSHPMITANLVRMLVESGQLNKAKQLHSRYRASYWLEDDATRLSHLIENSDRQDAGSASTAEHGVTELATSAETQTGTDSEWAVTSASFSSPSAAAAWTGLEDRATEAESDTGTDTVRFIPPALLEHGGDTLSTYTPVSADGRSDSGVWR